ETIFQHREVFRSLGFELTKTAPDTVLVSGIPPELKQNQINTVIQELLDALLHEQALPEKQHEIAFHLAQHAAFLEGKQFSEQEAQTLISELYRCQMPSLTPDGKPVWKDVSADWIEELIP
ncbi:MAG: hypothetical protein NZ108_09485, partial [Bacteroidia bacterium]|nr:hypothetical protein [Bacteroidia bacterium]